MGFMEAVASVFRQYATFSGRACRSEYWWFLLFTLIMTVALAFLDSLLFGGADGAEPLGAIFSLVTLVPSIAVSVRRLHDIDRSGWWYLLWIIPLIGWIIILWWAATRGTEGANRFGEDPLQPAGEELKEVFS